ncbi:12473_t:CDS:1, partial [Funneliformis mosseae]
YNQHWFLRRPKNEPRALYISPTINIGSKNPTVFQCYGFIRYLAKTDTKCPSPGATPPQSPSSSIDDNESSDNITAGSDYEETLKSSEQIRK